MISSHFHLSSVIKSGSLETRFQHWIKRYQQKDSCSTSKCIVMYNIVFKFNKHEPSKARIYFTAGKDIESLNSFIFDTKTQNLINDKIYDFYFEEHSCLLKQIFSEIRQFYNHLVVELYNKTDNIMSFITDYINIRKKYVSHNPLTFFDIYPLLLVLFDPLPYRKFKGIESILTPQLISFDDIENNIDELNELLTKLRLLNNMIKDYNKYTELYNLQQI